jgi:hypothetical protein
MDPGGAHHDLDLSAGLVQQCRRFERALSPTHDHDLLARELAEGAVVRRMRRKGWRQRPGVLRTPGKGLKARCNDDTPCLHGCSILQHEMEAMCGRLDPRNVPPIDIGHHLALKPLTVGYEVLQRYRLTHVDTTADLEFIECAGMGGVGNA